MPRLHHPVTGKPVDVPDHDQQLLAYYRGEGYQVSGLKKPRAAKENAALQAASDALTAAVTKTPEPEAATDTNTPTEESAS